LFAALQVPVDAVGVKLGPKSKFALIGKKWGRPLVYDDRVTIAKEVEIKDPKKTSAPGCCPKRPIGPDVYGIARDLLKPAPATALARRSASAFKGRSIIRRIRTMPGEANDQ